MELLLGAEIQAEAIWVNLFFYEDTNSGKCHLRVLPVAFSARGLTTHILSCSSSSGAQPCPPESQHKSWEPVGLRASYTEPGPTNQGAGNHSIKQDLAAKLGWKPVMPSCTPTITRLTTTEELAQPKKGNPYSTLFWWLEESVLLVLTGHLQHKYFPKT